MMGVNSLPKTDTRQHRSCNLNSGPSAPESSMLTTWLPSHACCITDCKRPHHYCRLLNNIENIDRMPDCTYTLQWASRCPQIASYPRVDLSTISHMVLWSPHGEHIPPKVQTLTKNQQSVTHILPTDCNQQTFSLLQAWTTRDKNSFFAVCLISLQQV